MITRLFVLCLSLMYLSGCGGGGGGSNSPTYSQVPVDTELKIYGVSEGSVMSRNCIYATIDRSQSSVFRQYSAIAYTLDTQLTEFAPPIPFGNKDTIQVTIPITTSGPHQFVVKGILKAKSGGGTEPGKKINFTVDYQLAKAGVGEYAGDRTVYTETPSDPFSEMRVEFATYAALKSANNLVSGGMEFTSLDGTQPTNFTGSPNISAATNTNDPYVTVDSLMYSATEQVRASGPGFNHFMELLLLQGPTRGTYTQKGDLRLYRTDATSKVLSAYCSSLNGYAATSVGMQSVLTLQSFDYVNFFGHLRLWNKGGKKVWTYQVAAYANAAGLSATNNALVLWPSIPTSPYDDFLLGQNTYPSQFRLTNPPDAKPSQKPGFLTVVLDADGKFKINQLSLKLDDFYDAAPNSIEMKMTYKP
jgi:hypothetical protein